MVVELTRVFAAVPLPGEVRAGLAARLEDMDIPGKPVPAENWHLTLRFLGSVDEVAYERFLAGLAQSDLGQAFAVQLGGLGAFPRPGRATVLWVGIAEGVDRLSEMAAISEEAAQGAGLEAEDRPFHAHLTLSRIRPPVKVQGLIESTEPIGLQWVCDRLVVYQSHLGGSHARYEPLETYELVR